MSPLTAEQLAEHLTKSAEEAFPKVAAIDIIAAVATMLLLKRAADQPGRYWIFDHESLGAIARSNYPDRVLSRFLEEAVRDKSRIVGAGPGDFKFSWNIKPDQIS